MVRPGSVDNLGVVDLVQVPLGSAGLSTSKTRQDKRGEPQRASRPFFFTTVLLADQQSKANGPGVTAPFRESVGPPTFQV